MDGERERVVIRERDGWIDGWVGEQHREECGGGGAGGRGVEWRRNVLVTVVFCTKKKTPKKHQRTQFHETSPQGSTL